MTISFTKPYPGGFRNKPNTSTPWDAAVGNAFQDAIAALVDAVNSGGTGGGGGGITITPDAGGLFATVTPTSGSTTTITDHSTYVTIT